MSKTEQERRGRAPRRLWAVLGALALLPLGAGDAHATNGPKPTAVGARAAGRGGVDYAFADDGTGPATNPAGMAFVYGNRFDQNWAVVMPSVTWTNGFGSFENESKPFIPFPAFSFGSFVDPTKDWEIAPLFDFGRWGLVDENGKALKGGSEVEGSEVPSDVARLGSRWRLGFGVFPITGGRIQLKKLRTPAFAQPKDWETDLLQIAISPSIAYRFNEYFSMGLTLQFTYGAFESDGGIAQPSAVLADGFEFASSILNVTGQTVTFSDIDDAKTNLENNNGQFGFSYRVGLMFNSKYFSAGLVYQERTWGTDYLGRAGVDGTDDVNTLTNGNPALLQVVDPRINPALGFFSEYDARVQGLHFPRYFGGGIALRPHRRVTVGFDVTYIMWAEAFRTFKTRLSNGSNPNLDVLTSPSIAVRVPLNYEDQIVFALGGSFLVYEGDEIVEGVPSWAFVLRAGYNFGKNPSPANTVLPQQPVITEHHVTSGFTIHVGPLLEFTGAVEYALPSEVNTGNHVGDVSLSNSTQKVSILFFQFGVGVNF